MLCDLFGVLSVMHMPGRRAVTVYTVAIEAVGSKIEMPSWGAVDHKQTCAHSCSY